MGCETRPPLCIRGICGGAAFTAAQAGKRSECVFGLGMHVVNIIFLLHYCFHALSHLEVAHSLILLVLLDGDFS